VRDSSVTVPVSEISSYEVTEGYFLVAEGYFLVAGMLVRPLPALTGGLNDVAYAPFIEDDFRV
jgi:hypothetical protein